MCVLSGTCVMKNVLGVFEVAVKLSMSHSLKDQRSVKDICP